MRTQVALTTLFLSAALMAQESAPVQDVLRDVSPAEHSISADLAMWGYFTEEAFVPASWNMIYFGDDLFEVRYNFDQTDALSLFYGHRFAKEMGPVNFSFTPAVGFTKHGGSSNVGLTTHMIFEGDAWKFYTINQYNVATSPMAEDIIYHWFDFGYHVTDRFLIGASDQYYESAGFSNMDAGPSLGFEAGNFYGKVYGWDLWSEEDRYYGLWLGLYFSNE